MKNIDNLFKNLNENPILIQQHLGALLRINILDEQDALGFSPTLNAITESLTFYIQQPNQKQILFLPKFNQLLNEFNNNLTMKTFFKFITLLQQSKEFLVIFGKNLPTIYNFYKEVQKLKLTIQK